MTNLVITSLFLIPDPSFVCPGAFRFSIGFENTVSDCRNEGYTWHAERPRGPGGSQPFNRLGQIPVGPIVRGEAYAPEVRIRLRELHGGIEFLGLFGSDQLDRAFDLLVGPQVLQADDLAGIEWDAHFQQGAMRVHDDGLSFLPEGRIVGQLAFQNHTNLKKQTLAAPASRGIVHYSETPRISALCVSRTINSL